MQGCQESQPVRQLAVTYEKQLSEKVSKCLERDKHVVTFMRGTKQCLCPVSITAVAGKMLRACPLRCVKAKKGDSTLIHQGQTTCNKFEHLLR